MKFAHEIPHKPSIKITTILAIAPAGELMEFTSMVQAKEVERQAKLQRLGFAHLIRIDEIESDLAQATRCTSIASARLRQNGRKCLT